MGKWAALQQWREDFIAQHNREPQLWLDKCCIDQTDIMTDLRCLPVFLSKCDKLLILCGKTYLSRLWCVVELFTFVHMGGKATNIEFVPVLRGDAGDDGMTGLRQIFNDFDAEQCQCLHPNDKERMLRMIHAAYGNTGDFTKAVHDILVQVPA